MDLESGLELAKVPLQGESSLPPPPTNTKHHRNPEDDDEYLIDIPPWTAREIFVAVVATCTVALSIVLVLFPFVNPFVMVTGIIGIVLPPYSALQEQKITDCRAMQETNAVMEKELNNLKYENERLTAENDELENAVDRMQKTKDTLAVIKSTNIKSIDVLESQLHESKEVLRKLKENSRAELVDNIFEVMLALDTDQNFILSDEEIDTITKKIEQIENIEVHDELFRKKIIEAGRDFDAVLKLLHDLLDDNPNTAPEEQKIIRFLSDKSL